MRMMAVKHHDRLGGLLHEDERAVSGIDFVHRPGTFRAPILVHQS